MSRIHSILLVVIILIASFLRLYKLGSIPPSLNWDETAAAYNAYTIENWAKDEWGKRLPLVFTSFRDDKHPVHIYLTSIVFRLLGESDFTVRLPSALLGVFTVLLLFLFGKFYFQSNTAGLFSALAIALSAYHIHYSRGLWEANFALSFLILGLVLFKRGIDRKNYFIPLSYFSFGMSLLSYHSSKIVVPVVVGILTLLYIKKLIKTKKLFIIGIGIFIFFLSLHFMEPRLLGFARINQNKAPIELIQNTYLYQKTKNPILGQIEFSLSDYKNYFSYKYLMVDGNKLPRGSFGVGGLFYKSVMALAIVGILFLLIKKKIGILFIILIWFFIAPIPAAFAGKELHATRAIFMLGPPEILAGFGLFSIQELIKNIYYKKTVIVLFTSLLFFEFLGPIKYYFKNYSNNEAIQWQYGMKNAVEYIKNDSKCNKVFVTKIRNQPYIFFLYYLKYPLPKLFESVKYDETGSSSYNTIESFDKYNFGNWDIIDSLPVEGNCYVVTKNEFTGFRYQRFFEIKDDIKYSNGDEAFYVVSSY